MEKDTFPCVAVCFYQNACVTDGCTRWAGPPRNSWQMTEEKPKSRDSSSRCWPRSPASRGNTFVRSGGAFSARAQHSIFPPEAAQVALQRTVQVWSWTPQPRRQSIPHCCTKDMLYLHFISSHCLEDESKFSDSKSLSGVIFYLMKSGVALPIIKLKNRKTLRCEIQCRILIRFQQQK